MKAKKLFARVSSGSAICEDDFKAKACVLSFSTLQALPKPYRMRLKVLTELLRSLFRGNGAKAFETAAIEDDGGTKMATNGALSDRILCNRLASRWSGYLCLVLKPPSSEKSIRKSPKA